MHDPYELNREKLSQARSYLAQEGIDCWLIKTKEGSDPCMPLMFGLSIVGDAVLIVTPSQTAAVVSSIDSQDLKESGLFDQLHIYQPGEMGRLLFSVIIHLDPKRIAINYSRDNHLADGLTVGSFRQLKSML
ncbi:MAG: M24 family metallopeptidase, partial [Spirochaetota bacterium]